MEYTEHGCPKCPHRLFGIAVCLLATACFSLGIADVVYTYSTYCAGRSTPACDSVPVHLTWVAVGIWASIPVFLTGISALRLKYPNYNHKRTYLILCSVSAMVFTPALVVISALEVWLGREVFYTFSPRHRGGADMTKMAIPLTIAVIGALLFILVGAALVWECCDGLPWTHTHVYQQHIQQDGQQRWKGGGRKRSAVDDSVYVLEIPIVGRQPPQAPFNYDVQREMHGCEELCVVHNHATCQPCMDRARQSASTGNWTWASPI